MGRVSDAMWRAGSKHEGEWRGRDDVPLSRARTGAVSRDVGSVRRRRTTDLSPARTKRTDGPVYSLQSLGAQQRHSRLKPWRAAHRVTIPIERVAQRLRFQRRCPDRRRARHAVPTPMADGHRHSASIAAAVVYNYRAIPIFEARARLIIEPNSAEVVPFRGPSTEDQGRLDYYVTQMEVLRSRALAHRDAGTARSSWLADPKAQVDQVSRLLGALGVTPVRSDLGESRVINVTYRSVESRARGADCQRAHADLRRSEPGVSPSGEPRCVRVAESTAGRAPQRRQRQPGSDATLPRAEGFGLVGRPAEYRRPEVGSAQFGSDHGANGAAGEADAV